MSFSPRYLVVVNLVLLALAAYSASAIVGTALSARLSKTRHAEISPPPPPIAGQSEHPKSFYALIHKRDIFNSAGEPTPAGNATPPPPEPTKLRLKLWGVAIYENDDSYCIIEEEKKREQGVYKVGAEVPGGAIVKAVEWDRVILALGGVDEILHMEDAGGGSKPATRFSSARGSSGKNARNRRKGKAGTKPKKVKGVEVVSDTEYIVDREEVDNALENMSKLFTQIRAVPHFEGGEATGFRLFAIRRGSIFDKIGLKNGDIIRNINGQAMNDPTRALALLDDLRDKSDLSVVVTRNRKEKTLSYTVR